MSVNSSSIDEENGICQFLNLPISSGSQELSNDELVNIMTVILNWSEAERINFLKKLLYNLDNVQRSVISSFLNPVLERDFITLLPLHLTNEIFKLLDAHSLRACENVSVVWKMKLAEGMIWKKLLERRYECDPVWKRIIHERKWSRFMFVSVAGCKELFDDKEWCGLVSYRIYDSVKERIHYFYKDLYFYVETDVNCLEANWRLGTPVLTRINCQSDSKGVYCFQYDAGKIVSGLRDNTIKIWDKQSLLCSNVLIGHSGSVLCLQYDERMIISGSSDTNIRFGEAHRAIFTPTLTRSSQTSRNRGRSAPHFLGQSTALDYYESHIMRLMRIWDIHTGAELNTLIRHSDAVLHLRFDGATMVSWFDLLHSSFISKMHSSLMSLQMKKRLERVVKCIGHHIRTDENMLDDIGSFKPMSLLFFIQINSKDRSVIVWDIISPTLINVREVLIGHRAAVNVVDFDKKYIVSASGDRTIKIWDAKTCKYLRTLVGHRRGIACLQYRDGLIVSGSSDNTIKIWDVEMGECIRSLEGHDDLVRCIRFDSKRIISGAYDGKIKVWDMKKALEPDVPNSHVLLRTLAEHTGRVFRLQFDEFQMISSSHDDTILIWNFLNPLTSKSLMDRDTLDDGIPSDSDDEAQDIVPPLRRSPRHNNRQIFRERDRNNDEGAGSD